MADSLFNTVSLLLPLDGSAAATTFRDYSNNHHVVTTAGNVISKPVGKYNGSAAYFDGTGDYLTAPVSATFACGTGEFTIEAWVYPTALPAVGVICDLRAGGAGSATGVSLSHYAGALHADTSTANATGGSITTGAWQHIAMTRVSNTLYMWKDGVQVGSIAFTNNLTDQNLTVGGYGGAYGFIGYLADLRITKGKARYTADFTAPTFPFRHALDPNVVLRLTGDDLFNYSQNTGAITVSGTAAVSATQFKYGTKSLYFDGTASYVRFGNTTDALGTSDFTIEFWVMPSTPANNYPVVIESGTSPSASWGVQIGRTAVGQKVQFWVDNVSTSAAMMTGATTLSTSAWSHVAITRSGTAFNIWVNGVSDATATSSANMRATADSITVGTDSSASAQTYFKGYIDDLAITKRCKYTATFTPPVAQLPTETTADEYLSSVSLQLQMDGTNASTTFTDSSPTPKTVTAVGNAQISTTQSRFGGSAMYLDGTGDYATVAADASLAMGTGDFTAEAWIYLTALPAECVLFGDILWTGGYQGGWCMAVTSTGILRITYNGTGSAWTNLDSAISLVTANAWHHVATVRQNGVQRIYLNGVQVGSVANTLDYTTGRTFRIGGKMVDGVVGVLMTGYIDDLRITKGVARYV